MPLSQAVDEGAEADPLDQTGDPEQTGRAAFDSCPDHHTGSLATWVRRKSNHSGRPSPVIAEV